MRLTSSLRAVRGRGVPTVVGCLMVGGLLLQLTQPTLGQYQGFPRAEEILDKYVEATGGKDAHQKVNNRVIRGTLHMPAEGITGTIEAYEARPNLSYSVIEIEGMVRQERGTDGKIAWERQSVSGTRILQGDELRQFMREAVFDAEVNWRELYEKAETVGIEEIDDKPAYHVELTASGGEKMAAYYDRSSGLLVKFVMKVKSRMGETVVETYPSDYRKVGGVLIPHKQRLVVGTLEQVLTFDSVQVNAKLDQNRFVLPEDVKQLLRQPKKTTITPKKGEEP